MDSQIVSSKVAELKGIPTQEELLKQLKEEVLVVTFNKLNGDERVMSCTKNFKLIPESHHPKSDKEPPKGMLQFGILTPTAGGHLNMTE